MEKERESVLADDCLRQRARPLPCSLVSDLADPFLPFTISFRQKVRAAPSFSCSLRSLLCYAQLDAALGFYVSNESNGFAIRNVKRSAFLIALCAFSHYAPALFASMEAEQKACFIGLRPFARLENPCAAS